MVQSGLIQSYLYYIFILYVLSYTNMYYKYIFKQILIFGNSKQAGVTSSFRYLYDKFTQDHPFYDKSRFMFMEFYSDKAIMS